MKNHLFSAMYGVTEEDTPTLPKPDDDPVELRQGSKSVLLKVEDRTIELPTMAYVRQLEQQLASQRRHIMHLIIQLRQLRLTLRQHGRDFDEVRAGLDDKMDGG